MCEGDEGKGTYVTPRRPSATPEIAGTRRTHGVHDRGASPFAYLGRGV